MWYIWFYIMQNPYFRSITMARDFTPEELEEIRKSPEFEKYVNAQGSNQESQTLLNNYIRQYGERLEIQFNTSDIIVGKVTSVEDTGDIYRIVLEDGVNRAVYKSPLEENNYVPAVGDNWSLRSSGKHFGAADNLSLRVNGKLVYSKSQDEMDSLYELNRAKTLQVMHNVEVLKEAFAKAAAEFEYDKEGSVKEFIAEKEKLFNSVRPIDLEYVESHISDWMKQDMIPYGGTAVAVPEEMKQMYQELSVSRNNTSKLDGRQNNNSVVDVPDLSRLDEVGLTGVTTAELVAMLRDPNYAGGNNEQFRREVADLFEKYHLGKTGNEAEFKAKMKELQARHTLAENEAIENFVSPRTARDLPRISLKLVPGSEPKPENVTHLEDREIPDLSQLVLHMRNNSMTASILQERLDDLRANRPDDKRAIEIYEAVINAYRTNKGVDKLNDMIKDEKDVLVAEDIAREVEYDNAYDVPRIKKQIIVPGPEPRPGPGPRPGPEPRPVIVDGVVMRGWNADEWQQLIDGQNTEFLNAIEFMEGVEITALKAINKLPDNFSNMTPDERRAVIEALSPVEMARFNGAMNTASQKILETYPPKFMVFLHQKISEDLKAEEAKKDKDANTVSMLTEQRNQLNQAMIDKLDGYVKGTIVVDQTSIADVYDGATEMFAYLKEQNKDSAVIVNAANEAQKKLDAEIKIYDETHGFDQVGPNDGAAIEKAFDKTSKMADEIKLEDYPEIQPMIDGLEFESDEDKKIFVDTIKEQAARTAAVKGFKDKDEDLKARFTEAFHQAATVNVGALLSTNELLKFEGQAEPGRIDPKALEANVAKAVEDLKNGKKVKISKNAAMAHAASAVNGVAGWLNRLATRKNDKGETVGIGTKAPVLKKMYDKIQHIDKTCINRFGPAYTALRSFQKAVSQNMISQGINQAARYGINAGCMLMGQPGLGAPLYATFYAAQAGVRLWRQYDLEKKANGGKINRWKFLGRHLPEMAQTLLITSATMVGGVWAGKAVEVLGEALPLDRCLSYAGMAVGGLTSVVKGYRASRKEGNGFWKSLGKSLGNTTLSTGMAMGCGWGIGAGINAMDTGLHSAGMFGETMTKDITTDDYNQHADDTVHYHKDILPAADGKQYFGLSAEELNEKGLIIEPAQAGDEGAFETKAAVPGYYETVYPDAADYQAGAEKVLGQWYAGHEDILESRVSALMEQGGMSKLDAMRCLMQIHDAGVDVPTEQTLYNEHGKHPNHGEPFTEKSTNMKVFGEGWSRAQGISQDSVNHLASMLDANGNIKVSTEGLAAFHETNLVVGPHNTVGHVPGSDHFHDSPLGNNSHVDDNGVVHEGYGKSGNTQWTTYAEKDAEGLPKRIYHEPVEAEYHKASHVEMQQEMPMTTTFDRYWNKVKSFCLLGRTGANGKTKEVENDNRPARPDDKTMHTVTQHVHDVMRARAATGPAK